MSIRIKTDLAKHLGDLIRAGVSDVLAQYGGKWDVAVTNVPSLSAWDVSVTGPNGFRWTRRFTGPERDAALIALAMRGHTEMARADLSNALARLITSGLVYTVEDQPNGAKIYAIDRIRLREQEIIALQKQGALTREGIRQYLVKRVA